MRIKDLRRKRLRVLIDRYFAGNVAAFARAIKRPAPNVHRWLATDKPYGQGISEDVARDIEAHTGVGADFLDTDDGTQDPPATATTLTPHEERMLSLWRALFQDQKDELLGKMETEAERAGRIEAELKRRGFDKFVPDQEVGKHIKPRPAQRELPLPERESARTSKRGGRGK